MLIRVVVGIRVEMKMVETASETKTETEETALVVTVVTGAVLVVESSVMLTVLK